MMVRAKPAPPTTAEFGLSDVTTGVGFACAMLTLIAFEAPPPGAGLKTVTATELALATSAALICAVSCVELIKVVGRFKPFQRITEPLMKFVPVAVSRKAGLPAVTELGLMLVSVGVGLLLLTVSVCAPDAPPPGAGLKTVMASDAALAMSLAAS